MGGHQTWRGRERAARDTEAGLAPPRAQRRWARVSQRVARARQRTRATRRATRAATELLEPRQRAVLAKKKKLNSAAAPEHVSPVHVCACSRKLSAQRKRPDGSHQAQQPEPRRVMLHGRSSIPSTSFRLCPRHPHETKKTMKRGLQQPRLLLLPFSCSPCSCDDCRASPRRAERAARGPQTPKGPPRLARWPQPRLCLLRCRPSWPCSKWCATAASAADAPLRHRFEVRV